MVPPAFAGLLLLGFASSAFTAEDPLRIWGGVEVERHVWMQAESCAEKAFVESLPGLTGPAGFCAPSTPDSGRVSAAVKTRYRNLIHRKGYPGFAYDAAATLLETRLRLPYSLEWRTVAEASRSRRSYQDSSARFAADPAAPSWTVRNSLALTSVRFIVPVIAAGAGTDGSRELALGGAMHLGVFSLTAAGGWKNLDLPVTLDLPGYRPLTLPLRLRQTFQAAAVEARIGNFDIYLMSRLNQDSHPDQFATAYSLSDSGRSAENFGGIAWTDSLRAKRFRFALEGARFEGRRDFRGTRAGDDGLYQFAYEETRQRNAWARAEAKVGAASGREAGVFAGLGAVRWDAYRPEVASGHYFWDRNGVLDSYEGSLLDLFSQQTYLFDGRLGLDQKTAGAWVAFPAVSGRLRLGLAWHRLEMEAYGRLTQKNTTFIIAYTERDYLFNFYGIEADLLAPEISFSRRFGRAFVEASLEQGLPLRVRLHRPDGSSGSSSRNPSGSAYSGGTQAWARMGWGFL